MRAFDFPETADIETSSDAYAQRFSGAVGDWFLRVQEKATLDMLAPFTTAKILDVGGGHGQLTPALIKQGHRVTVLGSHISCKRRIERLVREQQCDFDVGNILDLPYADRSFDVVVSYRLLPHVTQWKPYITELARVSRKAILVDYPAVCSVNYIAPLFFQAKRWLEGNTRAFTSFKEEELLAQFHACGFRRAERYPEFFFPMVLHRQLRIPRLSAVLESACRLTRLTSLFGSPVILKLVRKDKQFL